MSKKRRKGRGIDHVWRFVKFRHDIGIYALCSCGFQYSCCKFSPPDSLRMVADPERLYRYCPHCGARKTKYIEEVIKSNRSWWEE